MRVLILSAFLACAAAAPSVISPVIAPVLYHAAVAVPAAIPTVSPGDIQAAAIDAQVKVNDLARAAADKAQLIADQAVQDINGKAITDVNLANEKNEEAFWSNEEKKWQALDAIKTAEAQIDGAAASNADAYAKSALGAPAFVAAQPILPVVGAPIPPSVYSPYVAAVKTVSTQTVEVKAEENKEEKKEEAAVKTAEAAGDNTDSVNVEAAPADKPAELEKKPLVFANPVVAPFVGVYRYDVALPAVSPIVAQPLINYASSYQQVHNVLAPTVVKHAW